MRKLISCLLIITVFLTSCSDKNPSKQEASSTSSTKEATFTPCAEFYKSLWPKLETFSNKNSLVVNQIGSLLFESELFPIFHIKASGLEQGAKFRLSYVDLKGKSTKVFDGIYLGDGIHTSRKDERRDSYFYFLRGGILKGEYAHFSLEEGGESGVISAFGSCLPFPIKTKSPNGVTVGTFFVGASDPFFQFDFENLAPGEKVNITSRFQGKVKARETYATKNGQLEHLVRVSENEETPAQGTLEIATQSENFTVEFSLNRQEKRPLALLVFTVDHDLTTEEYTKIANKFYEWAYSPKGK